MKTINKLTVLSFFLTLLIGVSCKKETIDQPVDKNTLKENEKEFKVPEFKDLNDVNRFLENPKINKDFISYEDHCQRVLMQIYEGNNERFPSDLSFFVAYKEGEYEPIINNQIYRRVINRDRLYIVGNYAHKVVDNQFIVRTNKSRIEDLKNIESVEGLDAEVYSTFQYQTNRKSNGINKRADSDFHGAEYFYNKPNCRNDRKAHVEARATAFVAAGVVQPKYHLRAFGTKRRGTWCNWHHYHTTVYASQWSFKATFYYNGEFEFHDVKFPAYTDFNTWYFNRYYSGGIYPAVSGKKAQITFLSLHMAASTTGTNGNQAKIDFD